MMIIYKIQLFSVCTILLKFANDTKLFSIVSSEEDIGKLQVDLNNVNGHKNG